jgi:hypothetical protein
VRRRLADASWLKSADKLAGAFFAVFAAVGGLTKILGASNGLAGGLAAVGVTGAVVGLVLKALYERAKRAEAAAALWGRPPLRARDVTAELYELGVGWEAQEALEALGGELEHAPYVERDIDDKLRAALRQAAQRSEPTLVVVSGRSKTGKSRTMLEAAAVTVPDAWLLVPRNPAALATAARGDAPPEATAGPCVIWLDDLEPWAKPGDQGLSPETLKALAEWPQPVVVLATQGGKGVDLASVSAAGFLEITSDLLARAETFWLEAAVTPGEAIRLSEHFGRTVAERVEREGIGEFMIAAPRLIARLETDRECPEGQAIVRAAIDIQRAGLVRPLPVGWLQAVWGHYLPAPPTPEGFERVLDWATSPLYTRTALLSRAPNGDADTYTPYDYLVYRASVIQRRPIYPAVWERVIDEYAKGESEFLTVAVLAYLMNEPNRAELAFRRADELGSANGAYNLGVLLHEGGDLDGARAAFGRADDRGDRNGAYNLGVLLYQDGDSEGAEAAWRRADDRGEPTGTYSLGVLLEHRSDLECAKAAYRRAHRRAEAEGNNEVAESALEAHRRLARGASS